MNAWKIISLVGILAAVVALAPSVATAITIDGVADTDYGSAISTQALGTGFGDSTSGSYTNANGSELDAAYGFISNGVVHLLFAGNLENNFNKLEIFIDSIPGHGQNTLTNTNSGVDYGGLNRMGGTNGPGLTFDTGFAPDYWIGTTIGGSPASVYVNYAVLLDNGGGTGYYLGTANPTNSALSGGADPFGVLARVNNTNISGVDSNSCYTNFSSVAQSIAASTVTTGFELAIPLSAVCPGPVTAVKVCAFINGQNHDFISNQILGPIATNIDCIGNLGEPRGLNFSTLPGQHYFVVPAVGCNYSISPTSAIHPTSGGSGSVVVTAGTDCEWTATSQVAWVTITSGTSGIGNGTVIYSVASNTTTIGRSGTIIIAGQSFTVSQYSQPLGSIKVDGFAEVDYAVEIATQRIGTGYGDNTIHALDVANGSELDFAYSKISNGVLYLVLAGNLQNNFNKLNIFLQTAVGGQNTLTNVNPNVDGNGLNRMGTSGNGAYTNPPSHGLTFDSKFAPNYWMSVTCGGSPWAVFANYAQLWPQWTNNLGVATNGYFLGSTIGLTNGTLFGGTNPFGIQVAIDNSNTNGVNSDTCYNDLALGWLDTGIELAIPLEALGNPLGIIKVCAFITSSDYAHVSNQTLGPIWDGTSTFCRDNLGESSLVDFDTLPGAQYFGGCSYTVTPPSVFCGYTGGSNTLFVTAGNSNCAWKAISELNWIKVSGQWHQGTDTKSLSVATNESACPRTGTLTVADQTVTVYQQGRPREGITVDGLAETAYGAAIVTQQLGTRFGNSTNGLVDVANGSELDAAYGIISNGVLYLVLAGNLEANNNTLEVFLQKDELPGQSPLTNGNPNVDNNGLNRMAGLTFDSVFRAQYWIGLRSEQSPYKLHANYAQLWPGGTNDLGIATNGYYLGSTQASSNGNLFGGTNPFCIQAAINNRNTNGVAEDSYGCYTNGAPYNPGNVRTGVELAIPLDAIGNPQETVRVCAFINGPRHDYISNQILGPLGTSDPNYCQENLGEPAVVDFHTLPGQQAFVVAPPCSPFPTAFNVTGGGGYCAGGGGVSIGLSGSQSGVSYQLQLGGSPTGSWVPGTGSAISFGNQTTAGTYTVLASNVTTGCTATMTGNATVTVYSLTAYSVTGGGGYCAGGSGVPVGLSSSTSGVSYRLQLGGSPTGSWVPGTGSPISFGNQTTAGTYTVLASNVTTGCTAPMTGSATVTVYSLTAYSVTGGGAYCAGGSGVPVGLSSSESGVSYRLQLGGSPTGSWVAGTGSAISFGNQTTAGTYTVLASNVTTGCTAPMTGSASVTLPSAFECWQLQFFGCTNCPQADNNADPDGDGQNNETEYLAGMNPTNSASAWRIQASPTNGLAPLLVSFTNNSTGSSITNRLWNFGDGGVGSGTNPSHTYTNIGTYSVGLTIFNTNGTSSLVVSNLITVSCVVTVYVDAALLQDRFGNFAYGVVALVVDTGTNGFVDLQPSFPVSLGASWGTDDKVVGLWEIPRPPICCGAGILSGETVVPYSGGVAAGQKLQLYWFPSLTLASNTLGVTYYGKYTDTNSPPLYELDPWNLPTPGGYSWLGFYTETAGGSSPDAAGRATFLTTINSLPTAYSATGGGAYCADGSGVAVGLSSSESGVSYRLQLGGSPTGSWVPGTGSPISFGNQTTAGTYTVLASNVTTGSTAPMTGSATVTVDALPSAFSVTGGGSYCAGGSGVPVGLSGSESGVSYQLLRNGSPAGSPVAGTGSSIPFGDQTAVGTYTALASNVTTGCTNAMTASATVTVDALPTAFSVTGGGSYCAGGSGVPVGLSGSESGANYQLRLDGSPAGSPVAGTGSPISFGNKTSAGTYTVLASSVATGCTNAMTGSAIVTLTPALQCWQLQYFGCTNCPQADNNADPDSDGQNNETEYLAGMNPTNSASLWRIQASPTNGVAPHWVSFTDYSTGSAITNRLWDFGDGGSWSSNVIYSDHTYTNAGAYSVSLTIFNIDGTATLVVSNLITVSVGARLAVSAWELRDRFDNPMNSGTKAVLVVDTGTNGFVDPQQDSVLSVGASWGGNNKVIAVWHLTSDPFDGWLEGLANVPYADGIGFGQRLQLYWFPSLTVASNIVGATYYGKYTDTNSPPLDGSRTWSLPTPGSYGTGWWGLLFYTQYGGGSNPDEAGRATFSTFQDTDADGITDNWLLRYFGHPTGQASDSSRATDDLTGTGQNNLFKYTAGLDPTNPSSVFVLRIDGVIGQPNQKALTWKPWATSRRYTPEYLTNLVTGVYTNLTAYSGPATNSTEVSVTDLSATETSKFYRVRITYP